MTEVLLLVAEFGTVDGNSQKVLAPICTAFLEALVREGNLGIVDGNPTR